MQVNIQQSICNKVGIEAEGIKESGFPIKAFPLKIQSILIEWAKVNNYKVEYAAAGMLSAISTALGATYRIHIKGDWSTHAALYIILVGKPGLGKTPPLEAALKPIRDYDYAKYLEFDAAMKLYEAGKSTCKGKGSDGDSEGMEKPKLVKTIVSDFTPEALIYSHSLNLRGILIYVDEILGMFNSANRYSNGQLIEQILTAWSGGAIDVTRINSKSIHIERPNINIIGTTQTARVKELLQKGYKDNGLIDRILLVMPKEQEIPCWQLNEESSSDEENQVKEEQRMTKASKQWADIVNKVLELTFNPVEDSDDLVPRMLYMNREAKEVFYGWRNDMVSKQNAKTEDDYDNEETRFAKQDSNVARLALIIQVMRYACGESHLQYVDADSIRSAIALSEYFEDSYNRVQLGVAEATSSTPAKEMLDFLGNEFATKDAEAYGEMTKISRRTVMNYLKELCDNGLVRKLKKGVYVKVEYVKPADDSGK